MANFLTSLSTLLVLLFSFWGWGHGAARILYGSTFVGWFYPVTLGMTVVAVIGGIGNLLGISSSFFLWAIIFVGGLLAVPTLRDFRVDRVDSSWLLVLGGASSVVLVFLDATLIPSFVFNYHDDFHTYLARPLRMLQTGTLTGGWFDSLGWDSLGGQAFFQGFLLLVLPLEYIHGFDAVLCAALAVALAGELSKRLGVHLLFAVSAMAILVLINPMMVNISTLYAGTVIIQGMLLVVLLWHNAMVARTGRVPWGPAISIGLFLATLAVLKATLAVFAAFFFFLWLLGALVFYRERKRVVGLSALGATLAAAAAIAPWLTLHRENLVTALIRFIGGQLADGGDGGIGLTRSGALFTFWNVDLPYGGKFYYYTLLIAGLLAAGIAALILIWRRRNPESDAYLVPILAASISTVLIYLIFPYQIDSQTAVRYTCPVLLAVVPFAVSASGRFFQKGTESSGTFPGATVPIVIVSTFFLIVATIMFGEVLQRRFSTLLEKRTMIAHPVSKNDINYCTYALSSQAKENVRLAQDVTEPGTGILASISQSFNLNFSRNHVLVESDSALLVPWFDFLLWTDMDTSRNFLLDRGVRYIIWEHTGFGVNSSAEVARFLSHPIPVFRRLASRSLSFRSRLKDLSVNSAMIYNKNNIIVLDLEKPPSRNNE